MLCHEDGARCLCLPGWGTLIVSTDIHGNYSDFDRLKSRFLEFRANRRDVCWLQLGDIIHGPNDEAKRKNPDLYDYPDRSAEIVKEFIELQHAYPDSIRFLLGNHEHAHIGGNKTRKFYTDEAVQLEKQLSSAEIKIMHRFFNEAPLVGMGPCGLLFCHGSPDSRFYHLKQLIGLNYNRQECSDEDYELLSSMLNSYGQKKEITDKVLKAISRCTGFDLSILVHGHDRDEEGWFAEGGNQLCPVIFGAPNEKKRYLEIDLHYCYRSLNDLRPDIEIRKLYN